MLHGARIVLKCVFVFFCTETAYAAADSKFQHEVALNLSTMTYADDSKASNRSLNYSYHPQPVISSEDYPYDEAVFVARDTRIFFGTSLANTSSQNASSETSMVGVGTQISQNSWPVGVLFSYARYNFIKNYSGSDAQYDYHSTTQTLFGRLAVYAGRTSEFFISRVEGKSDTDAFWFEDSNYARNAIGFRSLFPLGDRMFGVANVGTSRFSKDQGVNHYESSERHGSIAWYPTRAIKFTLGSGRDSSNDVDFNASHYRFMALGWYLVPELQLSADLRRTEVADAGVERSTSITVDLRF